MNKALIVFIVGILLAGCIGVVDSKSSSQKVIEPDYAFLVYSKQAPNAQAREPQVGDIDTGVVGQVNGIPVRLYASRTWANNDYGKTFLWGDN